MYVEHKNPIDEFVSNIALDANYSYDKTYKEMGDFLDLKDLVGQLPADQYASLQAMAASGISLETLKVACLSAVSANYQKGGDMSSYDNHEVKIERPKKKLLDLSSYYTIPVNENDPDGEVGVFDDGGYEDETASILKRLEVFDFQCIKVTEEVAAALIDKAPECFKNCPDFQIVEKKDG